jgi:hypothetical protein
MPLNPHGPLDVSRSSPSQGRTRLPNWTPGTTILTGFSWFFSSSPSRKDVTVFKRDPLEPG